MREPGAVRVKICGLRDRENVAAAVKSGAAYLGFNFFPPSPRSISVDQAAALTADLPPGIARVALTVDADDATLDALTTGAGFDILQLHGTETPERVAAVKARYGLPVMKAVGIREAADLDQIARFAPVADLLLVDAKPPRDATLPGGNGLPFDWTLLEGRRWPLPWLLAGGLTRDNVAGAIRLTGARQIDLSSGVETAPGVKDPALIRAFIDAAQTARAPAL